MVSIKPRVWRIKNGEEVVDEGFITLKKLIAAILCTLWNDLKDMKVILLILKKVLLKN